MEKITAFDSTICKVNLFDDNLNFPNHYITMALDELKKAEVQENQSCNLDKGADGGELWSTFETSAKSFFSFPESNKLLTWVKEKIIQIAPELGFTNCKSVDLTVNWMNVMYKNSFGNCHTHDDEDESDTTRKLVSVFYLQAPDNSAKLLAIKNTKDYSSMGIDPFTVPQDEIVEIAVKTGDLIVHKVDMPHAVGKHLNDEPRLCLVMEFRCNE